MRVSKCVNYLCMFDQVPGLYGGGGGGPNIHTHGNINAHNLSIGLPGGPKQQQHGNPIRKLIVFEIYVIIE